MCFLLTLDLCSTGRRVRRECEVVAQTVAGFDSEGGLEHINSMNVHVMHNLLGWRQGDPKVIGPRWLS